jgi:chondroitin AC lyase
MRFVAMPRFGLILLATIIVGLWPASLHAYDHGDLNVVERRYCQSLVAEESTGSKQLRQKAEQIAASESRAGSWPSIDYVVKTRSQWPAAKHLDLTRTLAAAAYAARIDGHPDAELEAGALRGLRYWLQNDYQNPNWWWNQIGVPTSVGQIALLLRSGLSDADRQEIDTILQRSRFDNWTGENLVWMAEVQVMRGILSDDSALAAAAFQRMFEEVRRVPLTYADGKPGEGILDDNSFHQHGQQLYSGGYGLDLANDIAQMVLLSFGTSFQIPPSELASYEGFLLDGEQWMMRRGTVDYAVRGREVTRRETYTGANPEFVRRVRELSTKPVPRRDELAAFADRLSGNIAATSLRGNRMFWESDYSSHQRPGYFTSIRMLSTRSKNSEIVNQEGLRSFHLADGMNLLYRTAGEYRGIFAVWDWTLIPGTTAIHAAQPDGAPQTFEPKPVGQPGETTFVGGVSDGKYGAATMDLKRGPLSAKKSWFFFDDFYVCLGTDIELADSAAVDVATDVNQTLLRGKVYTSLSGVALSVGNHTIASPGMSYIFHDGVGYIFAPNTHLVISNKNQSGRWSDIGTGSAEPVNLPVFNLWIDHGTQPQDTGYVYSVFPSSTLTEIKSQAKHSPYSVLANTDAIQAVYVPALHRSAIVFRKAGKLDTPDGMVMVDKPCILLVDASQPGIIFTAANPDQIATPVHVSLGTQTATLTLTDGRSISTALAARN